MRYHKIDVILYKEKDSKIFEFLIIKFFCLMWPKFCVNIIFGSEEFFWNLLLLDRVGMLEGLILRTEEWVRKIKNRPRLSVNIRV